MSIDRQADEAGTPGRRGAPWLAVAALTAALAALAVPAVRHLREQPPPAAPVLRLALALPAGTSLGAGADHPFGLALAPDGRSAVFPAARAGEVTLWLRDLATGATRQLPGTAGALLPFWKPDGTAVAFFAAATLRTIDLADGTVRDLAPAPGARGGAWHASGDILFAPRDRGGLEWWRAATGAVEPFTDVDASESESSHGFPSFVPGADAVVFLVRAERPARQGTWIAPLDRPGTRQRLVGGDAQAFTAGPYLVHASDDALMASRLDTATLSLSGAPALIGVPVGRGPLGQLFATASASGLLVYGGPRSSRRELTWLNRDGSPAGTVGGPSDAWDVRIAPGGGSIAVTELDRQLATLDVWIYDGVGPIPRRLSPSLDADEGAVWAPDGSRLAWVSGRRQVVTRGAQGMLPEEVLARFDGPVHVWSYSRDGATLVASLSAPGTSLDLWLLPAQGTGEPVPYAATPFNETQGAVSPDGRWLAYASDESGEYELYLDSFPRPGSRLRLTLGGGTDPRWRGDGRELYFRRGDSVHALSIEAAGTTPALGATTRLFDAGPDLRAYDATADGRRFLVNIPTAGATGPAITAVVNWPSLAPREQPGRR